MAWLDKGFKQRIVGALVLVALAVIFLPMLLSRQEDPREVQVDAPSMPVSPGMPRVEVESVETPVPLLPDEPVPPEPGSDAALVETPSAPSAPVVAPPIITAPAAAAQPAAPAEQHLDADIRPVSWSIQLASLSSRENAGKLEKTLRSQGYNAYIRTVEGMNRVFVGPVIERAEANRLRDQLSRQQKLNGLVVRFQPERS